MYKKILYNTLYNILYVSLTGVVFIYLFIYLFIYFYFVINIEIINMFRIILRTNEYTAVAYNYTAVAQTLGWEGGGAAGAQLLAALMLRVCTTGTSLCWYITLSSTSCPSLPSVWATAVQLCATTVYSLVLNIILDIKKFNK
jgi:hypothetical protein